MADGAPQIHKEEEIMSGMRTIRVTGKGQLKLRPDMTRISLSLEGVSPEYGSALRRSSQDTERLKDLLAAFGFERTDLKTLDFSVDTEYENYKVRDEYKRRFVGYRYRHQMKIEFASDNARLGKVLYALANSPVRPEFRLSNTVSDPEAARNELLGKAVRDAMDKSVVLSRAAGVTLKDLQAIDYSWGRIDFEVYPMEKLAMAGDMITPGASLDMDIEPDDIEVTDNVTVVWEIG